MNEKLLEGRYFCMIYQRTDIAAAGKFGFHTMRTAARFEINGERIENLELIELEK